MYFVIQGISYAKLANLPAILGLCEYVDFVCNVAYVKFYSQITTMLTRVIVIIYSFFVCIFQIQVLFPPLCMLFLEAQWILQ